ASAAGGPSLAFVEWSAAPPMTRLATVAADGSGRRILPLFGVQPTPFEGPAFSADGSTLVFSGYPVDAKGELRESRPRLFAVGAEGGTPRPLPGTVGGSRPVLSPDGDIVAFKRARLNYRFDPRNPGAFGYYSSATTWTVPLAGGKPRRLTPWLSGLSMIPAAFSPDGSTLLLERDREPGWAPEIIARPLGGGPLRLISRRAEEPAFSPDGAWIALIDYRDGLTVRAGEARAAVGELYLVRADGTGGRRLTRTPAAQESQPSWSPGGARIAFLRTPGSGGLGFGATLMQANADGFCARRVTGGKGRGAAALYGPVWQPGAGREATVLPC
ncbi:MAG: TolB protein, partial [Solirubrobacterales bacterium]|nr:TolB protein [Solirubrobacterales bacterium]